jgi:hypothetical protein
LSLKAPSQLSEKDLSALLPETYAAARAAERAPTAVAA